MDAQQAASLLQSAHNLSNSQLGNQLAQQLANFGQVSLIKSTPTGNSNMMSSKIPASLSGAISNSSGIASGMPNLGGSLGSDMAKKKRTRDRFFFDPFFFSVSIITDFSTFSRAEVMFLA